MKRLFISALVIGLVGCAPPYVWGDEDVVKERLIQMVPLGSSLSQLEATAEHRGWDIKRQQVRVYPVGTESHLHDTDRDCRTRGGPTVPSIIAHYYAPFETYVETHWLFDPQKRLRDICVRKTTNAL